MFNLRACGLALAAALVAAAGPSPAEAGGWHGGYYGYGPPGHWNGPGWRDYGWRGGPGVYHWRRDRHFRRDWRGRGGGLSGAEAGLIAAGIVGAAILIDSANDRSARRFDDRFDDDRFHNDRFRDDRLDGRRRSDSDFYYRRDGSRLSDEDWERDRDDPLDRALDGRAVRSAYNYGAAYNDCKAETRAAAREEGLTVGLPARPDRIERIDGGAAVRFITEFRIDDGRRASPQTMVCEADAEGVRFLELV